MIQEIASTTIRDRIYSAATELYEHANRERFPTVDAVRRLSKADMNSVSLLMKEWRHAQTVKAAPVAAVAIPEAVQAAYTAAAAELWTRAIALANQSLLSAQAGWDAERAELEDMRADMATACDTQAEELEFSTLALAQAQAQAAAAAEQTEQVRNSITESLNAERLEKQAYRAQLEASALALAQAQAQAAAAAEQAERVRESIAENLNAERVERRLYKTQFEDSALDLAQVKAQAAAEAEQAEKVRESIIANLNAERVEKQTYKAQIEAAAAALAQAQTQAATAAEQAAQAREAAAELKGQLTALKEKNKS